MKGITYCGDCGYYNWKKHKCTRATNDGNAKDPFYADCLLPDVEVKLEPRVMTLEEVKSCGRNREIAFLVEYNDGGNMVWMLYYDYLSTLEEIIFVDEIAYLHHFGVDGYGIDWRCWTSLPTDEQRETIPWE